MTYIGRTRIQRLIRADKRFEPPVWRTFIHPTLVKAAAIIAAYPDVKYVILPDERSN